MGATSNGSHVPLSAASVRLATTSCHPQFHPRALGSKGGIGSRFINFVLWGPCLSLEMHSHSEWSEEEVGHFFIELERDTALHAGGCRSLRFRLRLGPEVFRRSTEPSQVLVIDLSPGKRLICRFIALLSFSFAQGPWLPYYRGGNSPWALASLCPGSSNSPTT